MWQATARMPIHTNQPTLQRHGQREGCSKQRQGCRRTPNSLSYSSINNERGVASNGKDADTHTTAHPAEPWSTRGMWQTTPRMPMHTQQPTLKRQGQREGCYEQRQGCRCTHNSPPYRAMVTRGMWQATARMPIHTKQPTSSAMFNERDVASYGKDADAHPTAHPTAPWPTRGM